MFCLNKPATKATLSVVDKFEKKNKWARSCKSRERIHFIYFKRRLQKSGLLIDGDTETVKHETNKIKSKKMDFLVL